jgi:lipopolysaccharide transport system ATP-binding protein
MGNYDMDNSIIVKSVSKQFHIGKSKSGRMLREVLSNFFKKPIKNRDIAGETMWALKDVSFAVGKGEIVGIIGRNGAGKSTLLKILSKITYPTEGNIAVKGKIGSLLEVGTGFHDELSGRENIYLNGSILGMTKREINSKMDEIIAFANVEKFLDTPIKHYSSGMRLRLGFSVAAHLDTDILLVDEVLAVGDVGFQNKCTDKIGDLREGGRTILYVSHQMASVENLCSRVIWIDGGQIREDGKPKEIIKHYLATFAGVSEEGYDLRGVRNRKGNGWIRYTGIEFLDLERRPLGVIQSGDSLVLRLYYQAQKQVNNNIAFGIQIFTDLGTLVTTIDSSFAGYALSTLAEGNGYIEAEIKSLYLMPGRYYFSLWIDNNSGIIFDCLEHSVKIDVEESDFYGSGLGITRQHGLVFMPYKWNFDGI